MPTSGTAPQSDSPSVEPTVGATVIRQHADAVHRAALEVCRQHDRYGKVMGGAVPAEERCADQLCRAADSGLALLLQGYERAVGRRDGEITDDWYRAATPLWMAAREYLRRRSGSDELTRSIDRHSPDELEALHTEFELEASALLALQQACGAYDKAVAAS
jgi:hypothetical protein